MALTTDRPVARASGSREIVVEFSPDRVRAPFALRCGSLFIDYILVIAVPVLGLLFDLLVGNDPADASTGVAWFVAILVAVSNLIIFPGLTGQTLGMMMCGLRIVRPNGREPSIRQIVLRNTVGYLATVLTFGLGFLIAGFTPSGRTLHDYLTGTTVIYARKRFLK